MSKTYFKRDTCRLCRSSKLESVLPLKPTALCDAYVSHERLDEKQEIYPLDLFLCRDCGYIHIPYVVDPEIIYRDYLYLTNSSLGLVDHFKEYAKEVMRRIEPARNSLVIDIGSNDGSLLRVFKDLGMRVLGMEPAIEIAKAATNSGVKTIPDFFNFKFSEKIKQEYGQASIVTINNLFANIDDLEDMAKGIHKILADDGVLIIESSYAGDMINNMVFDFIYHEHLSYFSVKPLQKFFKRFGMEMIGVENVFTKGGSLRYYFQLNGGLRSVSSEVAKMIDYEDKLGLDHPKIFNNFFDKIEDRKSKLITKLKDLKTESKTIVGYGGSATTTTLLYHFGLDQFFDYIVDDNPAKQNKFSPGFHIPILPSEILYERKPDYVVILAWRYAESIMKKHQAFLNDGGQFILPLPEFNIVKR